MSTGPAWAARVLAAFLGAAGVAHLAIPGPFDTMIPGVLPGDPRFWTYASGVAELAVAGMVAVARTRRLGGYAAGALFVAVFPANIVMAIDWSDRSPGEQAIAFGRLPLQVPLIWWAWRVARRRHPSQRRAGSEPTGGQPRRAGSSRQESPNSCQRYPRARAAR